MAGGGNRNTWDLSQFSHFPALWLMSQNLNFLICKVGWKTIIVALPAFRIGVLIKCCDINESTVN